MERFSSTNSMSALLYLPQDENAATNNCVYTREKFQEMMDGLDDNYSSTNMEETGQNADKKRRLSYAQVKAMEKVFEVDTKLDPGRKVRLAHELGLQPRQVAIWFQNRRARWKTKQIERDYNNLRENYESLKLNYSKLEHKKDKLITELRELKAKLEENNTHRNEFFSVGIQRNGLSSVFVETKGSSDNESMELLSDEMNHNFHNLTLPPASTTPMLDNSSTVYSSTYQYKNYEGRLESTREDLRNMHQQQWMKMEEGCYFGSSEESCNIFSVDHTPHLHW